MAQLSALGGSRGLLPSCAPQLVADRTASATCASTRSVVAVRCARGQQEQQGEGPRGAAKQQQHHQKQQQTRGGRASGSGAAVLAGASVLSVAGAAVAPGAALAVDKESVVETIQKIEAFTKAASEAATQAYEFVQTAAETVVTVSKPVVDAVAPVVKDATKAAFDAATPVATDVAAKAGKALEDSGLEVKPVVDAAKTALSAATEVGSKTGQAIKVATPVAQSVWQFLQSQQPTVLAAEAGALLLLYLAAPTIVDSIIYSIRGYAGDLTPAQALDRLIKDDYVLVDVRTEEQKEGSGVPSLPRNAKKKLLSLAVEEVSEDLRKQLGNPRAVEAELAAIKISSLKRISKSSKVILLDSYGETSRQVAKALASLGVRSVWAVRDGVDGTNGWANSALALDYYGPSPRSSSFSSSSGTTEVVSSPASIFSNALGTTKINQSGGTVEAKPPQRGLLLPGGGSNSDE